MADITALQARLTTWGKQLEEVIFLKKILTNESNFKPYSSFRSIELDFTLPKEGLQRIHHCIVVGGIVRSDPSKLLVNLKYCNEEKIIVLTFDVILMRSVTNKKQ